MDTLRFTTDGARLSEAQRLDLRTWLHENGRIARKDDDGNFDVADCTVTGQVPGHETDDDASIVRDTEQNRVHYSVMPERFRYERRYVQLDQAPTPFPASLDPFRVQVDA